MPTEFESTAAPTTQTARNEPTPKETRQAKQISPLNPAAGDPNTVVERKNLLLSKSLAKARQEIENLKLELARLSAPPLSFAVVQTVADASNRLIDVNLAGRRLRVQASDRIILGRLKLGDTVLLNEHLVALTLAQPDDAGEVVAVVNRIDNEHCLVAVRQDDQRIIRLPSHLSGSEVRPGDTLLVDLKTNHALSIVERPEFDDLLLEEKPDVKWGDIGGLDHVVEQIRETIELPLQRPELFKRMHLQPPKGLLLYGPPGVGKTMVAKALASSIGEISGKNTHFLNIKGPELLDKYVGETERRIRTIFARAADKAKSGIPVVIFFDEMESLFRIRGSGISSDVETTVVPQLLAEIDGVEELKNVMIIGASNREDMIDPAIMRPGRLDLRIGIERPDREACTQILSRYLNPDLPYKAGQTAENLKEKLTQWIFARTGETALLGTERLSGQEETWYLDDLVSGAMLASIVDKAKNLAVKETVKTGGDFPQLGLSAENLRQALKIEISQQRNLPGLGNPEEWAKVVGRQNPVDPIVKIWPLTDTNPVSA